MLAGKAEEIMLAPLTRDSLAGVIWVPADVNSVRVIAGRHYATAVDARGRAMLIDLALIDERAALKPIGVCKNADRRAPLFATATHALASGEDRLDSNAWALTIPASSGNPTSRPVQRSAHSRRSPVADPETGFLLNGELLQKTVNVMSATDPRISVKFNIGGRTDVGAVVPLGLPLPAATQAKIDELAPSADEGPDQDCATPSRENASPGVFRVQIALCGSLPDAPRLAVESDGCRVSSRR
jgi:hypothetical protein